MSALAKATTTRPVPPRSAAQPGGADPRTAPVRLVAIQVLRAAAALAVAFHHARHEAGFLPGAAEPGAPSFPWNAGVDVFFVISGFVMAYAAGPLFGQPGGGWRFLARRIARVVPLYWLATLLVLAIALLRPGDLVSTEARPALVIASFLFIPLARADGAAQPLYSLGWTLNYEMFFYVVLALALGLGRRRAVLATTAALAALVVLGRLVPALPLPLGFWADPIVLEFALGLWLGLARARGATLTLPVRTALGIGGFGLFWATSWLPAWWPASALYGLPAGCLVAACGLAPRARSVPAIERIGEALGDASYAMYLAHPFVLRAIRQGLAVVMVRLGASGAAWEAAFLALGIVTTALAALVVHRMVERPLIRLVRRRLEPERRSEA